METNIPTLWPYPEDNGRRKTDEEIKAYYRILLDILLKHSKLNYRQNGLTYDDELISVLLETIEPETYDARKEYLKKQQDIVKEQQDLVSEEVS